MITKRKAQSENYKLNINSTNPTGKDTQLYLAFNWIHISMKAQQKTHNRSYTEQVMMPAVQLVKPENKDTKPAAMSLNLDPWATEIYIL